VGRAMQPSQDRSGVIALVDRDSGKSITITLWESEDALRASEERADTLRRDIATAGDEEITGVKRGSPYRRGRRGARLTTARGAYFRSWMATEGYSWACSPRSLR
jgi:hypothetical protein